MFHPWRRVHETPELAVAWADTDLVGCYSFVERRATLASGQLQAERRCGINHEWWHHHRGPFPESMRAREERLVELLSARELIDLDALGDALVWTTDLTEAAEELWVDVPCLTARLAGLGDDERAYLERRLSTLDIV